MQTFRLALTGDFLGADGRPAYGDAGLRLLRGVPYIEHHFLANQSPQADDPGYWQRFYSLEVTANDIAGVNGLIVLRPWVKESTFARDADDLVVIGRSGAGYDKIDLAACTRNGVAVFNVPAALDHSTASTALMFMLALAKRLREQEQVARSGRWERQADVMGSELIGRTLGIIGLGRSGRELVRLASPFNMSVIAYSPHADPAIARQLGVRLTGLDDVLRQSDFISLHASLTPDKRHMIGEAELALMKPTAFLINVARGELVDEPALVRALRERRIAGAALDVYETEPLPADDPLTSLENVILTPHWSASSSDVWKATGETTVRGMLSAARGHVPETVLNPDVLGSRHFREKLARFNVNRQGQ